MALISAFSKLMLLFITAHVSSALNSTFSVVQTVSNVTLISGKEATLTCKYNRAVLALYWRYESTTSSRELIVALDNYFEVGKRSGPGYDEGRFNITDDYSLIIDDVQAADEGKYICEVSDYETGSVFRNQTDVTTIVIAERPFLRIEQCEDEGSADEINSPCVLHTTSDDPNIELTCTVLGAKPMVDLTWILSKPNDVPGYWKQVMNKSTFIEKAREDGTFDQTLTVNVDTSHFRSDIQHFTCFAEGLAVDGTVTHTIEVTHIKDVNVTGIVVVSVIATLAVTALAIGITWKARAKYCNKPGINNEVTDGGKELATSKGTLEEQIRKIKNMKADELVYLGVLGEEEAGKSSFINSIKRLIKGKDGSTAPESSKRTHSDNSMWEYTEFISKGLRIRKQRNDKAMITPEEMSAILMSKKEDIPSSRKHRKTMERSDLIHYPIFIFDIRNTCINDWDNRIELLRKFSKVVHSNILQYPMIVLTKVSASTNEYEEETLIEELIEKTSIPRGNILVTFDFLNSSDKIDEHTRREQLDFILKCLSQFDIQKKEIKKRLPRGRGRKESYNLVSSSDTGV